MRRRLVIGLALVSLLLCSACAGSTGAPSPVPGGLAPNAIPSSSCPDSQMVRQALPGIDHADPALAPPIGQQTVLGCAYGGSRPGARRAGTPSFVFSVRRYDSSDDAAREYDKLRGLTDKGLEKYARFEDFGDSQYRITVRQGPTASTYSGAVDIVARNGSYVCGSVSVLTEDPDTALLGGPGLHRILRKACGLPDKETATDPPVQAPAGATFDVVSPDRGSTALEWYCAFENKPISHAQGAGPVTASCPAGTVLHAMFDRGVDADGFVVTTECEIREPGSGAVVSHDKYDCTVPVPAV